MIRSSLRCREVLHSRNQTLIYPVCFQSTQTIEKLDENRNVAAYNKVPGPKPLELILGFLPTGKYSNLNITDFIKRLQSEHGNIVKMPGILGKKDIIFLYDPNDFEKVFRTTGKWPVRNGVETFAYYRKHVGPKEIFAETGGLVAEHGEKWADVRHKVNPVMLMPKTVKLYVNPIDGIAREFIHKIRDIRQPNNEMPDSFNDYLGKWSLESISYIALNMRLGLLDEANTSTDGQDMIRLVNEFFTYTAKLDFEPSLWRYVSTPMFKKLMKTMDGLNEIIIRNVNKASEKVENESHIRKEGELSVLEKLLKIDRNVAIVMVTDMMAAGIDTTSAMAVSVLYSLAKNPEKQQKLREELMPILTGKDTPFTIEATKNLPYLRACLKEALRMYPITSGNARESGEDVVLQGYAIPKGTDVAMFNQGLLEDNNQYADANKFLPERWLKAENTSGCPSAKTAHPFTYMPFGFGARACIGKRFAELEVEMLVSRLVRNFKIEWNHPELKWKTTLLTVPAGPLNFTLTDVEN